MTAFFGKWALVLGCAAIGGCSTSSGSAPVLTEGTACTKEQHDAGPTCSGTNTFNCKLGSDGTYHWDMVADCSTKGLVCKQGACVAG